MRKTVFTLLLSAALLSGCGSTPAADPSELPQENRPALQAETKGEIRYPVELVPFERISYAEDGQLLATYNVLVPVMTACREDGSPITEAASDREERALAAAETFNRKFSIWTEEESVQELTDCAQAELEARRESGTLFTENYALDLSCSVYETERLVSVAGLCYSNTGGVHPNTWQMGWNFDLETGAFFDGELFAADSSGFRDAVAEELIKQTEQKAKEYELLPEEMFWPEYETTLRDWSNYTVYFDETGMNVVFSPYELAPYAAGAQEFYFSYDWLAPLLSEQGCDVLGLECAAGESSEK